MKNKKSQVWCPCWWDFVYSANAGSFRGWSSPSHPCLIFMIILKLPDENHLPGYTSNACSAGWRILQFLFWRIRSPTISVKWGALAQVLILKSKVDHLVRAKAYFALYIILSANIQIIVSGKVWKTLKAMMNQVLTSRSCSNDHPGDYLHTVPSPQQISACGKKMTPCFFQGGNRVHRSQWIKWNHQRFTTW